MNVPYTELMQIARRSTCLEFCGVIVDDAIVEIRNVSKDYNSFVFSKTEWLKILNSGVTIQAMWHTHPLGDLEPSTKDIEIAKKINCPSLIVTARGYRWINPA